MSRVLPILFNMEMVRAILDWRKSCTRRIIKPQALCKQPTTISVERLNNRIGSVTEREMQQIDIALQIALNLDTGANTQPEPENQSGGITQQRCSD